MDSTAGIDANARIVDYWNRRAALNEAEWVDFYRCVIPLLMRTRLPVEYNDAARRQALVMDFFQDKILINAETSQAGPLRFAHALHGYLQNYEKDVRRRESREEISEVEPEQIGQCDPHADLLGEAGIDVADAMRSADRFVATLDIGERAYLHEHACADGKAEPVYKIAERLALRNFHHLAKRLGITRSKGETYRGYEKTKIGAWLLSVGGQLHPEWREELAALLILLCRQVRLRPLGGR